MDKYINKRIEAYVSKLKHDTRTKICELFATTSQTDEIKIKINELLEFVCEYERLVIPKDEIIKPKRVSNQIPDMNRCCAKRANNEQCTRIRRLDSNLCGTHFNNTPYGIIEFDDQNTNTKHCVELKTVDVNGIIYYIDKNTNVYNIEDVMRNLENPRIIGTYVNNVLRLI
jgi:hypothetical protein